MKYTLLIALLFAGSVYAEESAPAEPKKNIEQRITNQRARIQKKLEKGKIDEAQAAKLNENVNQVEAAHKEAAADGSVDKKEKRKLMKGLRMNSKAIHKKGKKAAANATGESAAPAEAQPAQPDSTSGQ